MAIHVKTNTPKKLLATFKKAIDDGHVATWSYDSDGDFTHTAEQWIRQAWLVPQIIEGKELLLTILAPREKTISSTVYAIYHGRFVESLLAHCDTLFEDATTSAMPEDADVVESE